MPFAIERSASPSTRLRVLRQKESLGLVPSFGAMFTKVAVDTTPAGYRKKQSGTKQTWVPQASSSGGYYRTDINYIDVPMLPYVSTSPVTGQGIPDLSKFRAPPTSYPYPTDPTIPLDSLLPKITDGSAKRGGLSSLMWSWLAWRKYVLWGTGSEMGTYLDADAVKLLSAKERAYFAADDAHRNKQMSASDYTGIAIAVAVATIATAGIATAVAAPAIAGTSAVGAGAGAGSAAAGGAAAAAGSTAVTTGSSLATLAGSGSMVGAGSVAAGTGAAVASGGAVVAGGAAAAGGTGLLSTGGIASAALAAAKVAAPSILKATGLTGSTAASTVQTTAASPVTSTTAATEATILGVSPKILLAGAAIALIALFASKR